MQARHQLTELQAALQQLRSDALGVAAFAQLAQQQSALAAALPVRFQQVLLHLLDRLEAGALFAEESCSFSQKELLDSLQQWTEKAALQLDKA